MIKQIVKSIKEVYRIVNDDTPERIIRELDLERAAVKEYLREHDPYQTPYCSNALDISDRESDVVDLLQFYMSMGIAERLDSGESKSVAAYLIKDRRKTFNREFPG